MQYKEKIVTAYYEEMGLPEPVYEFMPLPGRKFRIDISWPDALVGIECQGACWPHYRILKGKRVLVMGGGHSTGTGTKRDREKHNLLTLNSWRILYLEPNEVCLKETVQMIRSLLRSPTPYPTTRHMEVTSHESQTKNRDS